MSLSQSYENYSIHILKVTAQLTKCHIFYSFYCMNARKERISFKVPLEDIYEGHFSKILFNLSDLRIKEFL